MTITTGYNLPRKHQVICAYLLVGIKEYDIFAMKYGK